ncbi:MAG: RNA 2',3'-cyclic phosphodiesterase [Candidatus Jorgensenbacteria bacterium]
MRVFVAISVPPALQGEILAWGSAHRELPVRWLSGKNLHVTLVPPWEEEPARVPEVLAHLREAVGVLREPLVLSFSLVRFGPDPRRPRLIWAEGETPQALVMLSMELHRVLGFPPENRPYRLHLTIARFRSEDFSSFPRHDLDERLSWRMEANAVVLMQSHLLRGGAEYEVLREVPFSSSSPHGE